MPPDIQSIEHQNIRVNQPYSLDITIQHNPTTVTVEGLLEGFVYSYNTTTGILNISGTPTRLLENQIWDVSARNDNGETTSQITYDIEHLAPVIQPVSQQSFNQGDNVDIDVTIDNNPASVSVTGPLLGLIYAINDDGDGVNISGTIDRNANFTIIEGDITIEASNSGGEDTEDIGFGLNTAPVFDTIPTQQLNTVQSYSIDLSDYTFGYPRPTFSIRPGYSLPPGLSLSGSTISGTATSGGTFNTIIRASNSNGNDDITITFSILVASIPQITTSTSQSLNVNSPFSVAITASGIPDPTIVVSGLPSWLTYDASTGLVEGTPTAEGTASFSVTATNLAGVDTETISLTIYPELTLPDLATISDKAYTSGTQITPFTISATGYPDPTYTATNLPGGLTLNQSTGEVTGTPNRDDIGVNTVRFTATNSSGSDFQDVTITVNAVPELATIANRTYTAGTQITTFTVSATGHPGITYMASGLPDGLTFNATTRQISGTPTRTDMGVNTVTITATNSLGNDTETFTITVNAIPVLATISDQSYTAGTDITPFTISSVGYPDATYSATNLPAGLTLNGSTGVVSGNPTRADMGMNTVRFTATNSTGSDSQDVTITINAVPELATITDRLYGVGRTITPFSASATGYPTITYSASGLPDGLTLDTSTGEITGSPTSSAVGDHSVTITATNSTGTDTETFTIAVRVHAIPDITAVADQVYTAGTQISTLTITAIGPPDPVITVSGLPNGLSFNQSTGEITGTPTRTDMGVNTVTISATNLVGTTTATFDITVNAIPVLANITNKTYTAGTGITPFSLTSVGYPDATYSATNLPAGLTLNQSTGVVTGNPTRADMGVNTVRFTATNSTGSDFQDVTITINAVPVLSNITNKTYTAGTAITPFSLSASGHPGITYSATNLPAGLTISSSGVVTGNPTRADMGVNTVRFTATNSTGSDFQDVTITVNAVPVLSTITAKSFPTDVQITPFSASATGHPTITYSATGLPSGLTINPSTGQITGTPLRASTGDNSVTVTATNTSGSDTETFNIEITSRTFLYAVETSSDDAHVFSKFTAADTVATITRRFNLPLNDPTGASIDDDDLYIIAGSNVNVVPKETANNGTATATRSFTLAGLLPGGGCVVDGNDFYYITFGQQQVAVAPSNLSGSVSDRRTFWIRGSIIISGLTIEGNNLYVLDDQNERIIVVNKNNTASFAESLRTFNLPSGISSPTALTIDAENNHLYILDNNTVTVGGASAKEVYVIDSNTANGATATTIRRFYIPNFNFVGIALE